MLSKFLWKEGEFKGEMKFLLFANMASSMHSCTQVLGAVMKRVYYTQLKFIAQVDSGARTKKRLFVVFLNREDAQFA